MGKKIQFLAPHLFFSSLSSSLLLGHRRRAQVGRSGAFTRFPHTHTHTSRPRLPSKAHDMMATTLSGGPLAATARLVEGAGRQRIPRTRQLRQRIISPASSRPGKNQRVGGAAITCAIPRDPQAAASAAAAAPAFNDAVAMPSYFREPGETKGLSRTPSSRPHNTQHRSTLTRPPRGVGR